ncbi:hypothetical protein [Komagataeibacter oboediens]|uniref:hypothetical protein n=1 Tax=Komagataeibacter oboediens TaxID=65958 RepID=UPI001E556D19|nr:hypothetical protein [Komagataeibacter oboediens]
MNETPMYLVPGRLTDEQAAKAKKAATRAIALGRENSIADFIIRTIGTPIQPCADVETVELSEHMPEYHYQGMGCGLEDRGITERYDAMEYGWDQAIKRVCSELPEMVRRTDMEAQVARVAAEKDAEIEHLRRALSRVGDALAYEINEHSIVDTVWISPIETMDDFIDAALTEGAAG